MRIEQLMVKEVARCRPDEMLHQAARLMWEHDCGFLPVVDGGGRVVGVVTDRDACMAAYTRGQPLAEIRVGDVMSRRVRVCKPGDDLAVAEEAMREARVHRLPVVDGADHLLGVISLSDLVRESARAPRSKRRQVSPAEVVETLARIREPRQIEASSA